jgi:hypothetical protein
VSTHIKVGKRIVLRENILDVDCTHLEQHRVLVTLWSLNSPVALEGQEALDLVMELKPSALEGRRLRWVRHAWSFHNLVAHPLLQVLAWCGKHKLGFMIHDRTVPKPKVG